MSNTTTFGETPVDEKCQTCIFHFDTSKACGPCKDHSNYSAYKLTKSALEITVYPNIWCCDNLMKQNSMNAAQYKCVECGIVIHATVQLTNPNEGWRY